MTVGKMRPEPPDSSADSDITLETAAMPAKRGRGRPKGSKNKPKTHFLTESERIAVEESRRCVIPGTNITANHAVNRAQIKTAVSGGTLAQKAHLERIPRLEEKQREREDKFLADAEEYVLVMENLLERCHPEQREQLGKMMLPHPHDVVVDFEKRRVFVYGPVNTKERREWNEVLQWLESSRSQLFALRAKLDADPTAIDDMRYYLLLICKYYDICDIMPERYRPTRLPKWEGDGTAAWDLLYPPLAA